MSPNIDDSAEFRAAMLYDLKRLVILLQFTLAGIAIPLLVRADGGVGSIAALAVGVGVAGSLWTLS
ncbi:hypothetical protein B4589_008440 [Halolamina sp. CBA1230]|uniref:hypothetical protein n=1 Tax=Halolamina sp. CBA1230 TaxID=1853690 RepID=UPI0009A1BE48|nr:hypothetical protein [Halolamina sp. CBA1230]QKY20406.1 hypothetical protein B4589_008440 [Halolamina sp. CBA1230]